MRLSDSHSKPCSQKKKKKKKKKETDYRLNRYCKFKFHMIVATGLEQKFDYNIFV